MRLCRTEPGADGADIVARLDIQQQIADLFRARLRQHAQRVVHELLFDRGCRKRPCGRAGEHGGARAGKPRCVRILIITAGSSMAAMILNSPASTANSRPLTEAVKGHSARFLNVTAIVR